MESHLKEHNISSHERKKIDFCTILKANFIFSNNLINNAEKNHKIFEKRTPTTWRIFGSLLVL